MGATEDAINTAAQEENLARIKETVQDTMESTLENTVGLSDMGVKISDLIQENEVSLNPSYKQTKKEKAQNEWEYYKQILNQTTSTSTKKEPFINIDTKILPEGMNNTPQVSEITQSATQAKHKYFEKIYSEVTFNKKIRDDIDNAIDLFRNGDENNEGEQYYFNNLKNLVKSQLESYKSLYEYYLNITRLKKEKYNKTKEIQSKIDTYKQNLFIDSRKNNYENKNYEFYKNMHFYLLILYYSIFVLFLIFSNFIQDQEYYNKKILLYLLLYLIFPFILPYILSYLKYVYVYYLENMNEREEIVSYPDLVNKYHDKIE